MLLNTERNTSFEDLNRYFSGCFVIDPHTGKPARVISIHPNGEVIVAIAGIQRYSGHLAYSGRQAEPFYNLATYTTPNLGWRRVGPRVSYLYRRALQGGGIRGLNAERIMVTTTSQVRTADAVLEEQWLDRSSVSLCYGVFSPTNRSITAAIKAMEEAQWSRAEVINDDLCLLAFASAEMRSQGRYMVAFQRSVIGTGQGMDVSLTNTKFIKYLGATDGTSVHCP